MKRLSEIGEDELIRRVTRDFPGNEALLAGPGDDCAVWDAGSGPLLLLKTDALVERVHFLPDADPRAVGWKAISRVASDFAAMGGRPETYLVTVALRPDLEVAWVEALYSGMKAAMDHGGGVLAGGETTAVPEAGAVVISVAGTGRAPREAWVRRSTGRAGDAVVVTGLLGGSLRGKHLTFQPRIAEAAWLAQRGATAMMDLSDGLGKDLPRLATASGCGWEIDRSAVPRTDGCSVEEAFGDGEDYELLATLPSESVAEILVEWAEAFPELPLTVVGRLTAKKSGPPTPGAGWEHFR